MNKIIVLFFTLSLSLFGMSYAKFKTHILKHSKVLRHQTLSLQITDEENKILLRTKNPTLELEALRFNPNFSSSSFGYSVIGSQSIHTSNYYAGLEDKANASRLLQQAYVQEGKAGYIRTLEHLYTQYVYQSKLLFFLQEEYKLSNKVTKMVHVRYKNGSENRVAYLQAKTNAITLKTKIYTTKQEMNTLYHQLLAIGGFLKKISLENKFIYPISNQISDTKTKNLKQQILAAKQKLIKSQMRMNESSINSYELYAGIENEPDQSILKLGIIIALPLFNDKSEEKTLAKLKMQQLALDNEQLSINLHSQIQMIKSSLKDLLEQYYLLKVLKSEQKLLTDLLQVGDQIAQSSIFIIMREKNKLIQTQKSLLQTQKMINEKKIELRFIQGQYND